MYFLWRKYVPFTYNALLYLLSPKRHADHVLASGNQKSTHSLNACFKKVDSSPSPKMTGTSQATSTGQPRPTATVPPEAFIFLIYRLKPVGHHRSPIGRPIVFFTVLLALWFRARLIIQPAVGSKNLYSLPLSSSV